MANIIITAPSGKYLVEVDTEGNGIYKLKEVGQQGPIELLRENERALVQSLFLSDTEARPQQEVADQLGIPLEWVRMWRHDFRRKNRDMQDVKFEILKKVYGVDAILKRK